MLRRPILPTTEAGKPTVAAEVLPGSRDVLADVSETGRFVMFSTTANNIVYGINDRGFKGGVFLRDMQTGKATLVSTTTTGNVPSAGTFAGYALATDENAAGTTRVFLGGVGGGDMQSRFRPEDLPPLDAHIFALEYPVVTAAAADMTGVGTAFAQGPRIATRAGRVAIVSPQGVSPTPRILAFKSLAWSVEPVTQPKLGAIGTRGLFVG